MKQQLVALLLLLQLGWAITINETGGECSILGTWDVATKTCTLFSDYTGNIEIQGNGITLDGAGYTLQGTGYGISAGTVDGITIKNFILSGFERGISIDSLTNGLIENNEIHSSMYGIYVLGNSLTQTPLGTISNNKIYTTQSNANAIFVDGGNTLNVVGNTIVGNPSDFGGIVVINVDDAAIQKNTISNVKNYALKVNNYNNLTVSENSIYSSGVGIYVQNGQQSQIYSNTINGTSLIAVFIYQSDLGNFYHNTVSFNNYGLKLQSDTNMEVYQNNFIGNDVQALSVSSTNTVFNLDAPVGGNYWSDLACTDSDSDGFCDSSYVFSGGVDNLPWSTENGWVPPSTTEPPSNQTNFSEQQPSMESFEFSTFIVKVKAKLEDDKRRDFHKNKKKNKDDDYEPFEDSLKLQGWFTLSNTSDGLNPSTENVTVSLGDYIVKFDSSDFKVEQDDDCTEYEYKERGKKGFKLKFKLHLCDDKNNFKLDVRGQDFSWLWGVNETSVRFELGNDYGEKVVKPVVSKHKKIVLLATNLLESSGLGGLIALLFAKGP